MKELMGKKAKEQMDKVKTDKKTDIWKNKWAK